jgi:hypothetical protein
VRRFEMTRKALLVLAVLVSVGLAASVVKTSVFFKDGSRNQLLSGGSAVCTTQAISITTTPFLSLFFNTYVDTSVADSAQFNVTYQWGSDSSHFAYGIDTVKIGCYSDVGDTMRSLSRRYGEEFYPRVATHIRFLFSATTNNSDSAYIDSIFLVGQTIN